MSYFEWAKDLDIDHGAIDADHHHLVDLVNELHTATTEGHGQEVVDHILDELIRYTTDHLRREEEQMAAVNFPNLEGHKVGHKKFIDNIQQLKRRYDEGSISVAAQLSAVLRDWLSLHIRRSDKELAVFLESRKKKPWAMARG